MNFRLELAQPEFKSYKVITIIMAFLNAVSFIFYFLNAGSNFLKVISIAGLLISVVLLYVVFIKPGRWPLAYKVIAFLLGCIALCWLLAGNYYFLLLFILLSVFSFISLRPPVIGFTPKGISYPSFPVKEYSWQQLNQVLIKDDVLSMDFTDNKFLQFLLPAATVSKINLSDFNKSCEQAILAAAEEKS